MVYNVKIASEKKNEVLIFKKIKIFNSNVQIGLNGVGYK